MKRIFTVGVALAALFFASCEPNEDIYDKLDDMKKPYNEKISYVLVPTDYNTASAAAMADALALLKAESDIPRFKVDSTMAVEIKSRLSFNPRYTAIEYMRYVLDKNFPALKKGSAAIVTYNESTENIDYLTAVTSASKYKVSSTDYSSVGGSVAAVGYFIPSSTAQENIPAILSSAIASPSANQLALVTYKQSDIEPSKASEPIKTKKSSKADLFKTYNDFYVYEKSKWVPSTSFIAVQPHEYDEMGAPGKYNNFSADAPSINYIPTLLEVKYPYAQEGDNIVVAYNYYDGKKTTLTADLYIYKNGWESVSVGSIVTKTAQYVHLGDRWAFDPTVTFTMSKPDYQLIVDWVKDVLNRPELIDRGNAEFYAGASAYYGNYDIRISKRAQWDPDTYSNLTDDEANALIWNRLNESLIVMLQKKFPNAVAQVSGVEVFYNVSFIVFDGISKTYTAKFQCTADGSESVAPTFELISGPAVL